MNRSVVLTVAGIFLLAGCAREEAALQIPEEVINQSLAMFDGKVVSESSAEESSALVWKIQIANSVGANVLLYWLQEEASLHRIDGLNGPYDSSCDVLPGNGLINFRSAELAGRSALKNSDLNEWMLKREDNFNDLWVYTLIYNKSSGGEERAYVSASGGDILALD